MIISVLCVDLDSAIKRERENMMQEFISNDANKTNKCQLTPQDIVINHMIPTFCFITQLIFLLLSRVSRLLLCMIGRQADSCACVPVCACVYVNVCLCVYAFVHMCVCDALLCSTSLGTEHKTRTTLCVHVHVRLLVCGCMFVCVMFCKGCV